jgi:hypothetical protein
MHGSHMHGLWWRNWGAFDVRTIARDIPAKAAA